MTQAEKELLVKDLCARLPYSVKVNEDIQGDFTLIGLTKERVFTTCEVEGCHNDFPIERIKPYLFPISSMTEEQKYSCPIGYANIEIFIEKTDWTLIEIEPNLIIHFIDWLLKNHFDIYGLIPKGLANDATGLNIY